MSGRRAVLSVACGLLLCSASAAPTIEKSTAAWSGKIHPALGRAPLDSRTAREAAASKRSRFNVNAVTAMGFSPDGRFAYLQEVSGEGATDDMVELVLVNLDDDSEAETKYWTGKADEKEASALLEKWRIEPLKDQTLRPFPARLGDDDYDARAKDGKVVLTAKARGSKTIASFSEESWGILQSEPVVEGFYESPFEKRIVVLTTFLRNGYEGETTLRTITSGAWLAKGFKKKKAGP